MKKFILLFGMMALLVACNQADDLPVEVPGEAISLEKSMSQELPEMSVYHLPATWTNQDAQEIQMEELRGKVVVMVMVYTSCKSACPRLVADMRNIERQMPPEYLKDIQFVMVSIDPETDTPERLKSFSEENQMTEDHWMFLRGSEADTREFAAVLAVSYRQISPIDFSHSNIISVFDKDGVLVHQKEGLGVDSDETIKAIHQQLQR